MTDIYTVRVTKDHLVFSAGHFISFENGECERLHGHNWRVAVELDGPLNPAGYLFDFIALKDTVQALVLSWDHRMLIAMRNPHLPVQMIGDHIEVTSGARRWVFPKSDCILLEIENTTAELLAKCLSQSIRHHLQTQYQYEPAVMRVEVEENFGQVAVHHSSSSRPSPNASSGSSAAGGAATAV